MEYHDIFFVFAALGATLLLLKTIKETKESARVFKEFSASKFKVGKITDNIGNDYFSIVMEDCNGIYREIKQFIDFEKERYKLISPQVYNVSQNFAKSYTHLEEAEKDLKLFLVKIGQLTVNKNIEIQ